MEQEDQEEVVLEIQEEVQIQEQLTQEVEVEVDILVQEHQRYQAVPAAKV
jgi:hypothetical protein